MSCSALKFFVERVLKEMDDYVEVKDDEQVSDNAHLFDLMITPPPPPSESKDGAAAGLTPKRKRHGEEHQRCEVVSLLGGSSDDDSDDKGPSSKKQKKASGYLGVNDDHRKQYGLFDRTIALLEEQKAQCNKMALKQDKVEDDNAVLFMTKSRYSPRKTSS
jgi:hypothetical protein